MRRRHQATTLALAMAGLLAGASSPVAVLAQQPAPAPTAAWASTERALGRAGTLQPDGAMKFSFPRSDLEVSVGSVRLRPALALGGWLAFKEMAPGRAMAMGDLVVTEEEVGPVMAALETGAVRVTALHNHLFGESPRVLYMHVEGEGDPAAIGATLHGALERTKTPMAAPTAAPPAPFELDTAALAQALGRHGKVNGGVYQVGVPRAEPVREHGMEVPASMGLATSINFQPTGPGRAAITGDFVLTTDEVVPVERALRESGIQVTALHSHMLGEEPRLYFMHYWADDDALKLAGGLRGALSHTHSKAP